MELLMHALTDAAVLPPIVCACVLVAIKLYSDRLHRKENESDEQA